MNIKTLEITNFRSFNHFEVEGFGGVNLITGKNNSGKSTLLEAIRILTTEGSPSTLWSILDYREELDSRLDDSERSVTPEGFTAFCSFFRGFPTLAECANSAFSIRSDSRNIGESRYINATIRWFTETFDSGQPGRQLIPATEDLFGETSAIPALEVESSNRLRRIRIDRPFRYRRSLGDVAEVTTPCTYLDPFSSRSTSHLAALWDSIALREAEKDVVDALRLISPDIEAVNMIGGEGGARSRTAIAKSNQYSHPVPLRSFGDGVNRLFGLILSLSCARNGVLLVDEIENGLHHSVLVNVWRTIFRLAGKFNVQVFATSHSWDCVQAFQEAAIEAPEEGTLIRLSRKGDALFSTVFKEADLQIATRERIELR